MIRREDWLAWPLMVLFSAVLVVSAIYVSCLADCDSLGWMPLKDLPARCLKVGP